MRKPKAGEVWQFKDSMHLIVFMDGDPDGRAEFWQRVHAACAKTEEQLGRGVHQWALPSYFNDEGKPIPTWEAVYKHLDKCIIGDDVEDDWSD